MNPEYAVVSLIRGGDTFNLSDGTYCKIEAMDGIGPMETARILDAGPLQHGATDRGFRGQPRLIRLVLHFQEANANNYWDQRAAINEIMEPTTALSILRFDLGDVVRREIVGAVQAGPMGARAADAGYQKLVLDVLCGNPAFYDPNGRAVTFGVSYSAMTFQIPMEIPLGIGQSTIDASHTIRYTGSWRSYPYRIRIEGPITDCVLTNTSTGEKLDLTGTTIGAGDRRDIDLRYGYKTVVNLTGVNRIQDLTDDSDLTSWHLATRREVSDGDNTITLTGTGATTATEVFISYYVYFNGI